MFANLFISIFFIFVFALHTAEIRRDIVILDANEAPPFFSQIMPYNGMAGEIIQEISKAGGVDSRIVFKPLVRNIENDTNNDLGNPDFFIVNQDFAQIIPIALYDVSIYYYAPNQKDVLQFRSLDDLKGKRIGVLKGTLIDVHYFKKEGINFEESYSNESLFKKLKIGRLDMVIEIELVGQLTINNLFPKERGNFVKIPLSKFSNPIAIMLAQETQNSKNVADAFRRGLKEIIKNGTYKKILNKYYKEDIDFDTCFKNLERFEKLYTTEDGE